MTFKNPSFSDYREKKAWLYGTSAIDTLGIGDVVADEYNTLGIVDNIDEYDGVYVKFLDGLEGFAKDLDVKMSLVSGVNQNQYAQYKLRFQYLTNIGRDIVDSLSKSIRYVNMFNDGNVIRIKASTNEAITKKFTTFQIGQSHTYFSMLLVPKYDITFDSFIIKNADKKGRKPYNMLKNLLMTLSKHKMSTKFNYAVELNHEDFENAAMWEQMIHQFKKLQITDNTH